jgi:hypothetical protein
MANLRGKLAAALERANAGRQAKLTGKAEVAQAQGKYKKAAKLEARSLKTALRSENRQQRQDLKESKRTAKSSAKMLEGGDKYNMKKEGKRVNWMDSRMDEAMPKYPNANPSKTTPKPVPYGYVNRMKKGQ